jgi:hypothetical protein
LKRHHRIVDAKGKVIKKSEIGSGSQDPESSQAVVGKGNQAE